MGSSYTVRVFQREIYTGSFQYWSKKTGRFMTASIITLQMNLVAQILIYLPLPLIIDPTWIKEPAIPHICSHLPYLLPLIFFSNLTTPSDYPDILPYVDTNTIHLIKKYVNLLVRVKIGYCCRKHYKKNYKKTMFCCSSWSDKNKKFYYYHGFSKINSETRTLLLEHQHYMLQFFS